MWETKQLLVSSDFHVLDVNLGLDDMNKVLLFVTYSIVQDIISSEM